MRKKEAEMKGRITKTFLSGLTAATLMMTSLTPMTAWADEVDVFGDPITEATYAEVEQIGADEPAAIDLGIEVAQTEESDLYEFSAYSITPSSKDQAPTIKTDTYYSMKIGAQAGPYYCKFVPSATGAYTFHFMNQSIYGVPDVQVVNETELVDGGERYNIAQGVEQYMTVNLTKDKSYWFKVMNDKTEESKGKDGEIFFRVFAGSYSPSSPSQQISSYLGDITVGKLNKLELYNNTKMGTDNYYVFRTPSYSATYTLQVKNENMKTSYPLYVCVQDVYGNTYGQVTSGSYYPSRVDIGDITSYGKVVKIGNINLPGNGTYYVKILNPNGTKAIWPDGGIIYSKLESNTPTDERADAQFLQLGVVASNKLVTGASSMWYTFTTGESGVYNLTLANTSQIGTGNVHVYVEDANRRSVDQMDVAPNAAPNLAMSLNANSRYYVNLSSVDTFYEHSFSIRVEKQTNVNFTDVPAGAYYAEAVQWAVKNGITSGVGNNMFGPRQGCTRAQIVTFLYNLSNKPSISSSSRFLDVPAGTWYTNSVNWAVSKGITSGTDPWHFSPHVDCTRAQAITFMYKYKDQPPVHTTTSQFQDVSTTNYFFNPVMWAVEKGISTGKSSTSFGSNSTCTRAEIVTLLYNMYKNS